MIFFMELKDAVALINHPKVSSGPAGAHWADLGAGSGLFSRALGQLLGPGSVIYPVDRDRLGNFPDIPEGVRVLPRSLDFERDSWQTGKLDGILMANSLHYVADKPSFLTLAKSYLNPGGVLLIVEYDSDIPVPRWVPYPLSFSTARDLLATAGFEAVSRISRRPSLFGRASLYSMVAQRP